MNRDNLTVFHTEDGDLWGVFVYGHVAPASVLDKINRKLDRDELGGQISLKAVENRWMRQNPEEYGEDHPWELCKGGDGAVAVTGYFP